MGGGGAHALAGGLGGLCLDGAGPGEQGPLHLISTKTLARSCCRPIAHNEADFFAVQRRPSGDVLHYAGFQQQAARYLPSKGRSAAARAAMLTPRNPSYIEQPAAAEVDGFAVFVHHTVGVGSAGDVLRMLDSRGAGAGAGTGGSAGGSEGASGEEVWEAGQGGVQECLLLLAGEVEGEVVAETSAAEAAAAGAGLPA